MDPAAYLHLEGAYLTKSWPDIYTAVSFGATHSVTPTRGDFEELIHCLKYLEATQEEGLILKAGEPNRDLILKCNVDASYLTHPDSKSNQGYCLSFGDIGTFYSKSSKQQLVSTSSTQSEFKGTTISGCGHYFHRGVVQRAWERDQIACNCLRG